MGGAIFLKIKSIGYQRRIIAFCNNNLHRKFDLLQYVLHNPRSSFHDVDLFCVLTVLYVRTFKGASSLCHSCCSVFLMVGGMF